MEQPPELDPVAVRQQFSRRVERLARADFLLREVERRMIEKLEIIRLAPQSVVDVGTGLGQGAARLQQRFPAARVLGADLSPALAARAAQLHGAPARRGMAHRLRQWFGDTEASAGRAPSFCAADAARLPLKASSVDLIWSNLAWHWFADPKAVVAEWYRVIRPDGLVMFSSFGVDTLRELRALGAQLPAFPDMHDIGDALAHVGFADPVMDSERLQVTWESPARLLEEIRSLGGNALADRAPGLRGRGAHVRWMEAIGGLAGADGRIGLSFELVYGHAWCPPRKRLADGLSPLVFVPPRSARS